MCVWGGAEAGVGRVRSTALCMLELQSEQRGRLQAAAQHLSCPEAPSLPSLSLKPTLTGTDCSAPTSPLIHAGKAWLPSLN